MADRRAEGGVEVPIMLVVAVIISLVILGLGIGALVKVNEAGESIGSEYTGGETYSYSQLKSKCSLWSSSMGGFSGLLMTVQCSGDANGEICRETFLDSAFKVYSVMYHARTARLEKSAYYKTSSSRETQACIDAGEDLARGSSMEDESQALTMMKTSIETKMGTPSGKESLLEIARSCAALCEWVNVRGDTCSRGSEECANLAISLDDGVSAEYLP